MQNYFDVTAISSNEEELNRFGNEHGINVYPLAMTRKITPLRDIFAVIKLYYFLRKQRPTIVHTHTPKAGIIGMMAGYFARVPLRLHTVAGLPLMEASGVKRKMLNWVESLTYRYATKVYPNSKGLYDFILSEGFTNTSKLKVLGEGSSNGIDTNYFSRDHFTNSACAKIRQDLSIPESDIVFIFVGRIVRDKGMDELVAAFTKLNNEYINCSLLLVGPYENDLDPISDHTKQTIANHSKIVTTGYRADVRIFYALSDALVFPSYREGFPNVVLQAGAMGLPSIVSDINGCNEIIIPNKNGIIVPPKTELELYEAMKLLLTNKALYHALKQNARSMITDRYERSNVWQAILGEYQLLLSNL
jgi:glycosyltransferase involved in cell wall biosynthesis